MGSDPRALVLSPEAPYPVVGGGPLRTASLIEYLRQHYSVTVITFREPGAIDPRPQFPTDVQVHVIDLPFHSKSTLARAARNLRRAVAGTPPLVDRFSGFDAEVARLTEGQQFALGLIEHFWCAPYVDVLRRCCDQVVLDLHNVESVLLRRTARISGSVAARAVLSRFAAVSREWERRLLPQFDTVLVTSEADRKQIEVGAVVYPNTIPLVAMPHVSKRNEIVFSGNLEYDPNRAAVRWFSENVWPNLRDSVPELTWRLVGKNEHAVRDRLKRDGRIILTGSVDNAVEAIAAARASVVPVISGSGTRVKIIEAWAAGVPVVSTSIGAEGLQYSDGENILIADSAGDFEAAIRKILNSEALQCRLGAGGRRLYEEHLTWGVAWCTLRHAGLGVVKS